MCDLLPFCQSKQNGLMAAICDKFDSRLETFCVPAHHVTTYHSKCLSYWTKARSNSLVVCMAKVFFGQSPSPCLPKQHEAHSLEQFVILRYGFVATLGQCLQCFNPCFPTWLLRAFGSLGVKPMAFSSRHVLKFQWSCKTFVRSLQSVQTLLRSKMDRFRALCHVAMLPLLLILSYHPSIWYLIDK